MKAYIYESPKNVIIAEHKKPVPKDNELLIKLKNIGVCGSDIALYNGTIADP